MADSTPTYSKLMDIVETQIDHVETEYAENVGRIAIAWNSLHASLLLCFEHFLNVSDESAKALWECASSDRQQRNMLRALAKEISEEKHRKEFLWAIGKIDNLAMYRNSLIHAPVELLLGNIHHES